MAPGQSAGAYDIINRIISDKDTAYLISRLIRHLRSKDAKKRLLNMN